MKYCLGEGLKIPYDLAIVGFDDIAAAAAAIPPLSTVRVDKEALGRAGVDALLAKPELQQTNLQQPGLQQSDVDATQITLPVEMIVRESSYDD
jgi:DNA-binding LacI/PurR family transcriptional regulator